MISRTPTTTNNIILSGKGTHFYALKVQKSGEHYTEAAMDEVEVLDCIAQKRKHESTLITNGHTDEDPAHSATGRKFVAADYYSKPPKSTPYVGLGDL